MLGNKRGNSILKKKISGNPASRWKSCSPRSYACACVTIWAFQTTWGQGNFHLTTRAHVLTEQQQSTDLSLLIPEFRLSSSPTPQTPSSPPMQSAKTSLRLNFIRLRASQASFELNFDCVKCTCPKIDHFNHS